MCLISVSNLKEIHPGEGCFLAQSYCFKSMQRRRRKIWRKSGNFQKRIFQKLLGWFPLNLVCRVMYMEGIKYVNLIEIGTVVMEIRQGEYGYLAVPVNNPLVCHTSFLAADTRLCVLIWLSHLLNVSPPPSHHIILLNCSLSQISAYQKNYYKFH